MEQKLNVKLLDETLQHIEDHPDEWYQDAWRCHTGMCFAGWAVTLAGGKWVGSVGTVLGDELVPVPDDDPDHVWRFEGKRCVSPDDRAQRLLGVTNQQAEELFDGLNTLARLRRLVDQLKHGVEFIGEDY